MESDALDHDAKCAAKKCDNPRLPGEVFCASCINVQGPGTSCDELPALTDPAEDEPQANMRNTSDTTSYFQAARQMYEDLLSPTIDAPLEKADPPNEEAHQPG